MKKIFILYVYPFISVIKRLIVMISNEQKYGVKKCGEFCFYQAFYFYG